MFTSIKLIKTDVNVSEQVHMFSSEDLKQNLKILGVKLCQQITLNTVSIV